MTSQLQLGTWAPPYDASKGQWHTPPWLAQRMVEWAGVRPGMRVLEPSAGGGAIVRELVAAGALVDAFEIDPAWGLHLSGIAPTVTVDIENFLSASGAAVTYDLAVMNPPLDGGVGPVHIAHALRFCPRAVSVLRTVDMHGVERHGVLWSKHYLTGVKWLIRRPVFGGDQGTGAQADFVVVDVRRDCVSKNSIDIGWW